MELRKPLAESTIKIRREYLNRTLKNLPKPLEECTTDDFRRFLLRYGKTHKQSTTRMTAIYLSMFLDWKQNIYGSETKADIPKIRKMVGGRTWATKKAADMLTEDEVKAVIGAAKSSRDRAISI